MLEQLYEWLTNPVFTIYFCVLFPLSLCLAPKANDATLNIQFDFKAFRLQQFDVQGKQYGSRQYAVNFEATAHQPSRGGTWRRCMVVPWSDLIDREPVDVFGPQLGAVLVVMPKTLNNLTPQQIEQIHDIETRLTKGTYDMPVYFAHSNAELNSMLNTLQGSSVAQNSAFAALIDNVVANAYQLVVQPPHPLPKVDEPLFNIIGRLASFDRAEKSHTLAIVAYYDSFGVTPAKSYGADSNASGVAALLELLRVFSSYYATAKSRPNFDLIFVLSAGGQLNYQGSRHWIEQLYEQADGSPQIDSVICLDALAHTPLNMHVSKSPADGSVMHRLHAQLDAAVRTRDNKSNGVQIVTKKINLADRFLSWEHERYSIRRLPAFTLSHYGKDQHHSPSRRSVLDTNERADMKALYNNVAVICDALMRHVFNLPAAVTEPLSGQWDGASASIREDYLTGWVNSLSRDARAAQLLVADGQRHQVLTNLLRAMETHAQDVKAVPVIMDKMLVMTHTPDPELVMYPVYEVSMAAYRVKPAVFDLALATLIAAYLAVFYFAVSNTSVMLTFIEQRLKLKQKLA